MKTGSVSITRINELQTVMGELTGKIREAVVTHSPRLEVEIYNFTMEFLYTHTFERDNNILPVESKIVVTYHLQILFAALLFLVDEEEAKTAVVDLKEADGVEENLSPYYISQSQRRSALRCLFLLVWKAGISSPNIISALLALLDRSEGGQEEDGETVLENTIAANLLQSARFAQKKTFVTHVLNGFILHHPRGLQSAVAVLLLNDKVKKGTTFEACEKVVSLLVSSFACGYVYSKETDSVRFTSFSEVQQVELMSRQLLNLLTQNSGISKEVEEGDNTVLQKIKAASQILPDETVEDRLHLCLTLLLNRLLNQSKTERSAVWYRRYFYYNKYLLSPAFNSLTLRRKVVRQEEVLETLKRLHCLLRGVTLGASPSSLVTILEATAVGLLNLFSIVKKLPADLRDYCNRIIQCFAQLESCFSLMTRTFVKSCISQVSYSLAVDNIIEPQVICKEEPCSTDARLQGLKHITEYIPRMSSSVFYSLVESITALQRDPLNRKETVSALVTVVEGLMMDAEADTIFGDTSDFLSNVVLLRMTLSLDSVVSQQWSLDLLEKLLSPEFFEAQVSLLHSPEKRRLTKLLIELQGSVQRVCDQLPTGSAEDLPYLASLRRASSFLEQQGPLDSDSGEVGLDGTNPTERLLEFKSRLLCATLSNSSTGIATILVDVECWIECQRSVYQSETAAHCQFLLFNLFYFLLYFDDPVVIARSIKCVTWMGMYRMDSKDGKVLTELLVNGLSNGAIDFPSSFPKRLDSPAQKVQRKLHLLEVLVSITDYDQDGLTLRGFDRHCTTLFHFHFYELLFTLCHAEENEAVQAAALHCIGPCIAALRPIPPLLVAVHLCEDVLRQGRHEMVKAAAASMMASIVASFTEIGDDPEEGEVLKLLSRLSYAMTKYSAQENTEESFYHASVIRQHGEAISGVLKSLFPFLQINE